MTRLILPEFCCSVRDVSNQYPLLRRLMSLMAHEVFAVREGRSLFHRSFLSKKILNSHTGGCPCISVANRPNPVFKSNSKARYGAATFRNRFCTSALRSPPSSKLPTFQFVPAVHRESKSELCRVYIALETALLHHLAHDGLVGVVLQHWPPPAGNLKRL